jgi:Uma2 family endonuclease
VEDDAMSTLAAPTRELTPDDVLDMTDGVRYELVDGRLVESNTTMTSSRVAGRIAQLLSNHCESPLVAHVLPERGFVCFPNKPNKMRRPDVSVVLADRTTPAMFEEGFTSIRPDIAVEVVSSNDLVYELRDKLADYRAAAIPLVWVVYPPSHSVEVLRSDSSGADLGPDDELTGEDILPGFRCRVADLFAGLPETTDQAR